MNRKICVLLGLVLLAHLPTVPSAGAPASPDSPASPESQEQLDQRYLLLATKKTSTMQAELDQAAAEGYRLLSTWWGGAEDETMVVLEKGDDLAPRYEYRLLAALRESTLARELQDAAAVGFRLTPAGVSRNMALSDSSGAEVMLILERTVGETEPHEYRFIDVPTPYLYNKEDEEYVGQLGALQAELDALPDDGYELVALFSQSLDLNRRKTCDIHHIVIAEKLPGAGQELGQRSAERTAPGTGAASDPQAAGGPRRFRLIAGRPGAKVQQELNEAAATGYRLRSSTLVDLPDPDHVTLIMEHAGDTSAPHKYLLVGSAECCLGAQHDLAAERGYAVHPRGIFGEPLVAIMERAPGDQPALDYAWVRHDRTGGFQEGLAESSDEGFELAVAGSHTPPIRQGDGWKMGANTHIAWLVKKVDPYPGEESRWGVRTDVEWETLLISASDKDEEIAERLNEAAKDGYCLINLAAFANTWTYDRELSATMEKRGNGQECEYAVLAAGRTSALQKDIDGAAREGFQMLRSGMFAKHAFMGVTQRGVVMERTPGNTTPAYEYLLLTTQRKSTLQEEMDAAAAEGFEFLARANYGERTVFMVRPVAGQDGAQDGVNE